MIVISSPYLNGPGQLLIAMIVAHLLLDYPLQGDFLAKAKNHQNGIDGVPWVQALMAHSILQAAGVWLVTGSMALGFFEFIAHAAIDYGKSAGWYQSVDAKGFSTWAAFERAYHVDQLLHILCKALWVWLIIAGVVKL